MPKLTCSDLLLVAGLVMAISGRPDFKDFPVKEIFKGVPVAPRLVTKDQRMFRSAIRQGAKSKVEFAGHFTVPQWGCGSGCGDFVIVDSTSGRVYDGLVVAELPLEWVSETKNIAIDRLQFRANSRLLKINGCPGEKNCGFYDYEMVDGVGLKLVDQELLPKKYQPE